MPNICPQKRNGRGDKFSSIKIPHRSFARTTVDTVRSVNTGGPPIRQIALRILEILASFEAIKTATLTAFLGGNDPLITEKEAGKFHLG